MAERFAGIEQRMAAVERQTASLDEMQGDTAALRRGQTAIAQGQAAIIERLDAGFAARKQDEDLALREIRTLKGRVTKLERRVKRLESAR